MMLRLLCCQQVLPKFIIFISACDSTRGREILGSPKKRVQSFPSCRDLARIRGLTYHMHGADFLLFSEAHDRSRFSVFCFIIWQFAIFGGDDNLMSTPCFKNPIRSLDASKSGAGTQFIPIKLLVEVQKATKTSEISTT